MSNVIDAMEEAIDATGDVVTALKVAEVHGWRLVPVEPDIRMEVAGFESDEWDALSSQVLERGGWPYGCNESAECVSGIFKAMTEAAPRPWAEKDEVKG